jgi:hypothetical protein
MHSAGIFHEQSRADRDNYVEIIYENVNHTCDYLFKFMYVHFFSQLDHSRNEVKFRENDTDRCIVRFRIRLRECDIRI